MTTQVEKDHYNFSQYMDKSRWASVWHQIDEIAKLSPSTVLEIGPGPGALKKIGALVNVHIETLDMDPALEPDHLGSATSIPFPEDSYDVVCAFQMLEHLPFQDAMGAFEEMVRTSRRHIIISLPDAKPVFWIRIYVSRLFSRDITIPIPLWAARKHHFDGEHHWEINKKGFELPLILEALGKSAKLVRTYRVPENPYHRFFVFEKNSCPAPLE